MWYFLSTSIKTKSKFSLIHRLGSRTSRVSLWNSCKAAITLLTKSCKQFKAAGLRGRYKTLEYLYSKNVDDLSSMSIENEMSCINTLLLAWVVIHAYNSSHSELAFLYAILYTCNYFPYSEWVVRSERQLAHILFPCIYKFQLFRIWSVHRCQLFQTSFKDMCHTHGHTYKPHPHYVINYDVIAKKLHN